MPELPQLRETTERRLRPTGEAAPAWPAPVRSELARRRERITAACASVPVERVLDLGDPDSLSRAVDAGRSGAAEPDSERVEVVVSIAALVAVADLPAVVRGVARLLDPDGRFLFVEPVARPGWTGVLAASAGALLQPFRGQHVGRDVLPAVRAAGFVVTDLERFTMPTLLWPLRAFVDGCARPCAGLVAPPREEGAFRPGAEQHEGMA